jgi:hypothetical protein
MIVAIGLAVDETLMRFVECAAESDIAVRVVDLAELVIGDWRFELSAEESAELRYAGKIVNLHSADSFFCRIIDLSSEHFFAPHARRWQALTAALGYWLDIVPSRVANRCDRCAHNSSKPLHETILQKMGFDIPESLTSCARTELVKFVHAGPAISKAICGVRADCITVEEGDFEDFEPANGPVHLQRQISGADARIHVVGGDLIAQKVVSGNIDYRRGSALDHMEVFTPPPSLRDQLVTATRDLGLAFAGWDFKIEPSGKYWCLEANPMPGYLPYDLRCGGAISRALVAYLST